MTTYYCHDCCNQCAPMEADEVIHSEFGGSCLWNTETYLMCELCGSYEVEEND